MFVAMNRFRVVKGSEAEFEQVWKGRDSRLHEVEGFVSFHLLKGEAAADHTLYCSHSVWRDRAAFEGWTKSAQFRHAHKDAGGQKPLYLEAPKLEIYESVEGA